MNSTRSFRVLAVAACALALPVAGTAAATDSACSSNGTEVESLTVALAQAPVTVRAGRAVPVPVTVQRASLPAAGVLVQLSLKHGPGEQDEIFAAGRTDATGRVRLAPQVPASATGTLWATVVAHAPIASLPCHQEIAEHGSTEGAWGRAVR